MQYRALTSEDALEFQALRLEALTESPAAFASSYEEECGTAETVISERLMNRSESVVFGAFRESHLIGMVGIYRETHLKLSHKAWVWGMYITPAYRQQGVGRQLLTTALEHATTIFAVRQVNLGVNMTNVAAIALYESLGFQTFGIERGFMILNGELQDEMHMVWISPMWTSANNHATPSSSTRADVRCKSVLL